MAFTDTLRSVLHTFDGLEYTLRVVDTQRAERYTVKRETEMDRRVAVKHIYLTLYKVFEEDGQKYRGSYATEVPPSAAEAEIRDMITQGLFAAGFVKNEYYPLPAMDEPTMPPQSGPALEDASFEAQLQALQNAFDEVDTHQDGHICYNEIYLSRYHTRIINSNGVDVSYDHHTAYVETAVHWRGKDGKEIEVTEAFNFSEADPALLTENLRRLFTIAEQKSHAAPMPVLTGINILLSGECLSEFFSYYCFQSDAQYAYRKLTVMEPGQSFPSGDRLTLVLDPFLPGSSKSRPYDNDGKALSRHTIIENGTLLHFWGSTRFAHYMHLPPTGDIANYVITGGTAADDALRAEPYIELVSFSAFQMNPVTGDFGSEIRLGFYFDGEKTVPVTGGSISGNINKVQDGMRFSAAERQFDYFRGPATIMFRGATIAGVE